MKQLFLCACVCGSLFLFSCAGNQTGYPENGGVITNRPVENITPTMPPGAVTPTGGLPGGGWVNRDTPTPETNF